VSTQSQTSDLLQEASKTNAAAALKITFFILNNFLLMHKETKLFYFTNTNNKNNCNFPIIDVFLLVLKVFSVSLSPQKCCVSATDSK
jgi:hypothetical protein